MATPACVARDIDRFASYWQLRKFQFIDAVGDEFTRIVQPAASLDEGSSNEELFLVSLAMTEWFLFERPHEGGKTPLDLYVERRPAGVSAAALRRLRQVARTQFFSRFSIVSKCPRTCMAVLEDTREAVRYDVYDEHLCRVDRWRDGVIAERIGYVDGLWQLVGRLHLYDRAPASATAGDAPGDVHPEDADLAPYWERAGFYLRLLRDCLGVDGRYRATARFLAADLA